ncbi:hypothetical protein BH11BAC5_BH11BAC5_42810 [soil metagenome]
MKYVSQILEIRGQTNIIAVTNSSKKSTDSGNFRTSNFLVFSIFCLRIDLCYRSYSAQITPFFIDERRNKRRQIHPILFLFLFRSLNS